MNCFQAQNSLFTIIQGPHLSPFSPLTCGQMVIKAPFIAFDNKSNRQFLGQAAQQTNINKGEWESMTDGSIEEKDTDLFT